MLYLTLAAIVIGSCTIETSAGLLVITSNTSDKIPEKATLYAEDVDPTRPGRIGWVIPYRTVIAEFPNLDFNKDLSKQLKATFEGKPLNNLSVAVNMWSDFITALAPSDIVATYQHLKTGGLYHDDTGIIKESKLYFEADN